MASGDAGERLHFAHFKTARGGGAGAGKRAARTTLTMSSMISRLRAGSTPILGLGGAMAIAHDVHARWRVRTFRGSRRFSAFLVTRSHGYILDCFHIHGTRRITVLFTLLVTRYSYNIAFKNSSGTVTPARRRRRPRLEPRRDVGRSSLDRTERPAARRFRDDAPFPRVSPDLPPRGCARKPDNLPASFRGAASAKKPYGSGGRVPPREGLGRLPATRPRRLFRDVYVADIALRLSGPPLTFLPTPRFPRVARRHTYLVDRPPKRVRVRKNNLSSLTIALVAQNSPT